MDVREEPWREKCEKNFKNYFFRVSGCWKIDLFGRNAQKRSKVIEVRAGPTPIDPRGHDAMRICDICGAVSVEKSKNLTFSLFQVPRHRKSARNRDSGRPGTPDKS